MAARRKSGFTLIELLVVIAIIAILAAILFPVFARARETARKSTCGSNMHECGLAIQTYWNDYDATLPAGGAGDEAFITGTGALPPAPNAARASWTQKIYDYLKSKDITYCPSDSAKDSAGSSSYWWKAAANDAWNAAANPCRKESDFGFTADQIILYEHQGFHSSDNILANSVQINVCYLDTHVRNVNLKNVTAATGNPAMYPTSALAAANGSGEPMYYNHFMGDDNTAEWAATADKALKIDDGGANPRKYADKL